MIRNVIFGADVQTLWSWYFKERSRKLKGSNIFTWQGFQMQHFTQLNKYQKTHKPFLCSLSQRVC